ncbi:hypothetical protein J3F83DRAFT_739909 [Trichoderma novae-zelandiae]
MRQIGAVQGAVPFSVSLLLSFPFLRFRLSMHVPRRGGRHATDSAHLAGMKYGRSAHTSTGFRAGRLSRAPRRVLVLCSTKRHYKAFTHHDQGGCEGKADAQKAAPQIEIDERLVQSAKVEGLKSEGFVTETEAEAGTRRGRGSTQRELKRQRTMGGILLISRS